MDLRQLEVFLSVAKHLHFGRAAEELYLSQPTVSQTIRRLEADLGGELFDRSTRNVTLTDLGVRFVEDASDAYDSIRSTFERGRQLAQAVSQRFVIGHSMLDAYELVDYVCRLRRRMPRVEFELRLMNTSDQMRAMAKRRITVALCCMPDLDEHVESLVIGTNRLVVMVPAGHALARQPEVTIRELQSTPIVMWGNDVNPRLHDLVRGLLGSTGQPWRLGGTVRGDVFSVATRVLCGAGAAVMLGDTAATHAVPGVVYVPISGAPPVERTLVWRRRERHEALRPFVDLVAKSSRLTGEARRSRSGVA